MRFTLFTSLLWLLLAAPSVFAQTCPDGTFAITGSWPAGVASLSLTDSNGCPVLVTRPPPPPPPPGPGDHADDFERPDGSPGPNWAYQGGSSSAPYLRSGHLGSNYTSLVITWWAADPFANDQFSEGIVSEGFNPATTAALQVIVRHTGSLRYGFHFASGNYYLKYDGGNPAVVLASVPGVQFAPGDVVRLEAQGNQLRGLVNGVVVIAATHDILTGGQPGLVVNPIYATALRAWASWRGGSLP